MENLVQVWAITLKSHCTKRDLYINFLNKWSSPRVSFFRRIWRYIFDLRKKRKTENGFFGIPAKLARTDKSMASSYSTGKPLCPKERTDRESQISGFRFNLVILLGVLILWISKKTQNLFLGFDFPEEILSCPS